MSLPFQEDLRLVLNRHSAEAPSGTPDYILAEFLTDVLKAFNEAVGQRAEWRGENVDLPALQKLNVSEEVESGSGLESMLQFIVDKIDEADGDTTININVTTKKSGDE